MTDRLTDADIKRGLELAENAAQRPWRWGRARTSEGADRFCYLMRDIDDSDPDDLFVLTIDSPDIREEDCPEKEEAREADAVYILEACNNYPMSLTELRSLRQQLDAAQAECRRLEHDVEVAHAHRRIAEQDSDRLRQFASRQSEEIESLNGMADAVEVLRDIGMVIGCGHVDGPDERRQLVNCIEQEFSRVTAERDRLRAELLQQPQSAEMSPVAKWIADNAAVLTIDGQTEREAVDSAAIIIKAAIAAAREIESEVK